MQSSTRLKGGRMLLSMVAVFTMVAPFVADWNATHIYNPLWPPHAKFHNAQTMAVAGLLGGTALFFLWRGRARRPDPLAAALIASLYWLSQAAAFAFPGVAWTDPNLLKPGEALTDFPMQLQLASAVLAMIALSIWLMAGGNVERRSRERAHLARAG